MLVQCYPENGGGDDRHTWHDSTPAQNQPEVGTRQPSRSTSGVYTKKACQQSGMSTTQTAFSTNAFGMIQKLNYQPNMGSSPARALPKVVLTKLFIRENQGDGP